MNIYTVAAIWMALALGASLISIRVGIAVALAEIDILDLAEYYLFHAVRADLLSSVGRNDEARGEYASALARTSNAAERAFMERARNALPA